MLSVPTEAQEAKTLVAYLRLRGLLFTHTPNETGSDPSARRRAIRMKQQGTARGFPDYLVVTKSGLIAIELKRAKKSLSRVSPEQAAWITALNAAGTPAYVAYGADEAIAIVEKHQRG